MRPMRCLQDTSLATPSLSSLLEGSRKTIEAYLEAPADPDTLDDLRALRHSVASELAQLPARQKSGPEIVAALELLEALRATGCYDSRADAEDVALADEYSAQGWPGLLAAMSLVPAWQWPGAPRLGDVARWLWPAYTSYLFNVPQGFREVGHAKAYTACYRSHLQNLLQLAEANRGSSSVKEALAAYLRVGNCIPLYFTDDSLRSLYELRGKILTIAAGVRPEIAPPTLPREGRRLRIGFVNRHFGSQTETYSTLPTFEQLDPDRFEVILFAYHSTASALEVFAKSRAADFRLMPADPQAQVKALRDAELDVVVFGTNVTAVFNEVTRTALHRVAPLQVVNNSSCTTSGLPEIDLYVSGTLTETADSPTHFTERLGLLPGPAHAFNYEADRAAPTLKWTRAALGIPEDAVVFVSAANFYKVIPEVQETWARLLAATPGSRLLLHPFNPNWSSAYPIKRFCADFDRVLGRHGVAEDRLLVSSLKLPSRSDVKGLVGIGDVYLDTYPFSGVNSLVDPLEAGVPAVAWDGTTFRSRMGGSLLRSLGLDELVATDAQSYHALCVRLAGDATWRAALREKIAGAMGKRPIFLDPLAHSDAFGGLIEAAYDDLAKAGPESFRKERKPLVAEPGIDEEGLLSTANLMLELGANDEAVKIASRVLSGRPTSIAARHLKGHALMKANNASRASVYLLAAEECVPATAGLWRERAVALRKSGDHSGFIDALQTSLKIDGTDVESWFMLGDAAHACNHADLQRLSYDLVSKLAPDDPRTAALRSRMETAGAAV
jgi:protein O-GlcNAc transferase